MKKTFILVLLFSIALLSVAQSKFDFIGMWKIIVAASGPKAGHTVPTFLLLKKDGSYVWGIDSTATDPMKGVSKGTWVVTSDGAIKFIPADKDRETVYYAPSGNSKYKYRYTEKNGKKTLVHMLEMDFFIEKYH